MRITSFFALIILSFNLTAQVGVGTTTPEAALDIVSSSSGILIPRIALNSIGDITTVQNPKGGVLAEGTMVWNTGTGGLSQAGFYFWQNSQWNLISSSNQKQVQFGRFVVNSSGNVSVTGLGFTPSSVEFVGINRIQGINEGAYRSSDNNSNDIRMASGMTVGYAQNNGGAISQQVIANGSSGSSINNIGTYSSSSHCVAAFFVNNNGEPIHDNGTATSGADSQGGLVRASLQSFDSDGFTLNFDRFLAGIGLRSNEIVIIYKAYR